MFIQKAHRRALLAAGLAGITLLASCSSNGTSGNSLGKDEVVDTSNAAGEINYWLWDNNQKPAYQQCASDFNKKNPAITVKITQYSWDDYWTTLTNSFVAGTAPDVFTNHVQKYPEFVSQNQLLPLDATLTKDGVSMDRYQKDLADLWVGQDGKRYGLPKDFDTTAIYFNKKLVEAGGITSDQLANMSWNPDDGGTYEKIIAHLTVDTNGNRGDEPGFDKTKVKVYGLGLDGSSGGGLGQTQWAMYTGTLGWTVTDKNPWGTHYNYNKPEFQKTIAWMRSLIDKGYMPTIESITGQASADLFGAGKYAMITNGSWIINQMFGYKGVETGLAPNPIGPTGKRSSMFNGLADSVWVGTKNKAAAIRWVEYLGSPDCQDIVGERGVVFPAIDSGTKLAEKSFAMRGIDVEPFLVHLKDGTTFLPAITDYASQINNIMTPATDAVMTSKAPADSLTAANDQVNALFGS